MKGHLAQMMARHVGQGKLEKILLRPERRADPRDVPHADIDFSGLIGDHGRAGKRAVTLLQAEHVPVIAKLAGQSAICPSILRRNLVISGINLAALRKSSIRVGDVILHIEGPCPPCSRMEEALGPGGYNAMRGHGGWYASVLRPGGIAVGDAVVDQGDGASPP